MSAAELERLRRVYRARLRPEVRNRYDPCRPGERYIAEGVRSGMAAALGEAGRDDLNALRILEVGCGRGQWLGALIGLGASPELLWGVDLIEEHLAHARARYPGCRFAAADVARLPFESAQFDIVLQMTLFTSILDKGMRAAAAAELSRVLRPGGAILWYDFRYPSPANRDVQAIGRRGLARLFPHHRITTRTLTVLPPVARALAGRWPRLCRRLEAAPWLRSHIMAVIEPLAP
jgi:SAM-dependent methyltransferase